MSNILAGQSGSVKRQLGLSYLPKRETLPPFKECYKPIHTGSIHCTPRREFLPWAAAVVSHRRDPYHNHLESLSSDHREVTLDTWHRMEVCSMATEPHWPMAVTMGNLVVDSRSLDQRRHHFPYLHPHPFEDQTRREEGEKKGEEGWREKVVATGHRQRHQVINN